MQRLRTVSLLLILLLGVALRFHLLTADLRLQPDEALFSTFARAAAVKGDWFLPGPLDKPPLAIYANALAQVFVGDNEVAARLPGAIASILLMPVMFALSKRLYSSFRAATWALLLTALSPLLLRFGATAYTDGLMLLCITLALLMLARRYWASSGLWLGLGFAAKFQALFYLPLLLALGWATAVLSPRRALRCLAGMGIAGTLLILWDSLRPGLSVFTLAAAHNNPARFIRSSEILPRLAAWLDQAQAICSPSWLTALLLIAALAAVIWRVFKAPRRYTTLIDLTLVAFVMIYALLHWLLAFDTYDRYLLPLLPPLILLVGRAASALPQSGVLLPLMAVIMIPGAWHTVDSPGDDYGGIDDLAAYLNNTPVATVIFDHWLGWELGYYLGPWHNKRMVYYPTPSALVKDALRLQEIGPRYFPVPADAEPGPWLETLHEVGFAVRESYRSPNFVVFQLQPP